MHTVSVGTTATVLAMAVASVLIVGLTFIAIYCIAGLEFVFRRLAENPEGPFLAMSILLGAIAAALKAFS